MSDFIETLKTSPADVVLQDPSVALNLVKSHVDEVISLYKKNDQSRKTEFEEITISGLDANQVWWQAKMVLDNIEGDLMERINDLRDVIDKSNVDLESSEDGELFEGVDSQEEAEIRNDDSEEDNQDSGNFSDAEKKDNGEHHQENEEYSSEEVRLNEEQYDSETKILQTNEDLDSSANSVDDVDETKADKYGVNDKFFDFEEFNRQTLVAEENNDINEIDGESVDYFEDIPSDEDEEALYYEDFFDKPKSRETSNKNRTRGNIEDDDLTEADFESAVNSAKLDLFAEDEEALDEESKNKEQNVKLSSFERQQLSIQEQIEELEKEAVAQKKWTLKGEAKAQDRPNDALLTEDIEFDRTAKPVPVITAEVTESLDDMIRRRIKDENFDDLQRRPLTDLTTRSRKPQFELSDQKSSKSLAQIYEEDYAGEAQDAVITEEVQKSHDEISELFSTLSYKLNALSSAHFIPRPPQKSLEVRVETDTITMEDAQPLSMSSASALAPQEIYKIGKSKNSEEIKLKNGVIMSKEELTREDKNRLRRAIKRKRSKAITEQRKKPIKKSKKNDAIETLSKAKNVTIIDKKGDKSDVRGNKKNSSTPGSNVHQIKL